MKSENQTLNGYVNDERERLLSTLPEEKRSKYEKIDLVALRDIVQEREELINKKISVDSSRGGTSKTPPKAFHEMSAEEVNDPESWNAYLTSFKRK